MSTAVTALSCRVDASGPDVSIFGSSVVGDARTHGTRAEATSRYLGVKYYHCAAADSLARASDTLRGGGDGDVASGRFGSFSGLVSSHGGYTPRLFADRHRS